jgi:hypothetical protein
MDMGMSGIDPQTAYYIRQAFADLPETIRGGGAQAPLLTHEIIVNAVQAAFQELDLRQLEITRHLSPAQRFYQVCDLNRFLRHAAIAAIHQQHPNIDDPDLSRELLRRMGTPNVPRA